VSAVTVSSIVEASLQSLEKWFMKRRVGAALVIFCALLLIPDLLGKHAGEGPGMGWPA
jgi:hypothetical protein